MQIELKNILEQLNSNLGLINLILSFVVAGSTLIYSILSWKLTNETKRMREVYTEPKMSITVEEIVDNYGFFDLVIKNVGMGPAYHVDFVVDTSKSIDKISLESINRLSLLTDGIPYIGPSQALKSNISHCHSNDDFFDTVFDISVAYTSAMGKRYFDKFTMKHAVFHGVTSVNYSPVQEISNSLKGINGSIKNVIDGSKEIKVVIQTVKGKEQSLNAKVLSRRNYLVK